MDEQTLTALEASIKHWEENINKRSPIDCNFGIDSCALCRMFWRIEHDSCHSCPVFQKTGLRACRGTPYSAAYQAREKWYTARCARKPSRAYRDEWRRAAQAEVDFLRSLLPES